MEGYGWSFEVLVLRVCLLILFLKGSGVDTVEGECLWRIRVLVLVEIWCCGLNCIFLDLYIEALILCNCFWRWGFVGGY